MTRCKYSYYSELEEDFFECPLEAEPENEYCFWHQEKEDKRLSEDQLDFLKSSSLCGVYLRKANLTFTPQGEDSRRCKCSLSVDLEGANLKGINLSYTDLVGSLKDTNLSEADFQEADLYCVNMENTNLNSSTFKMANLQNVNLKDANLFNVDLECTDLSNSNLEGAHLFSSILVGANLTHVNLKGADLSGASLQGACLFNAVFDSESCLDNSCLVGANLYHSYIDETKSFRNAIFFNDRANLKEKEINESIADNLGNKLVLDAEKIRRKDSLLYSKLKKSGFVKGFSSNTIIYEDMSQYIKDVINNPEYYYELFTNSIIIYDDVKEACNDGCELDLIGDLDALLFGNTILRDPSFIECFTPHVHLDQSYVYKNYKKDLYEASYEVYNKLYNFYSSNGDLISAKHAHYRRGEVYRKLLLARGGIKNKLRAWIFDGLILKGLAGHGDKIWNPIIYSVVGIILFALSFLAVNGVQVEEREAQFIDYFYLSLTTFTGLGFSNVQPDITVPLMQPLVMAESAFGLMMVSLIIFVITYQISR